MDHLLELFQPEHVDDILDVELQMLQDLLVVAPSSKFYKVSTVLFHKDEGANIVVTNCMSYFSMFVPTNVTVKFDNVNTGHAQFIWIVLCNFPNFPILDSVGLVHYFTGHPSNNILFGALKF